MIKKRLKMLLFNLFKNRFKTEIQESRNQKVLNNWDEIFDDDIFLVSYPRSGNTWLRYLLTNLRFPNASWDVKSLYYSFPEVGGDIDITGVPRPRWIKSHMQYNEKYKKVIYLYRDGRDVAVSFYNWSGKNKSEPFKSFLKTNILGGKGYWGSWHEHVNSWWNKDGVLYVKYEDLVENTEGKLKEIAAFINLKVTEKEILAAIDKSTFKRQQKDFDKNFDGKKVGVHGKPGSSKEYFNEELNEYFYKVTKDVMNKLSYSK